MYHENIQAVFRSGNMISIRIRVFIPLRGRDRKLREIRRLEFRLFNTFVVPAVHDTVTGRRLEDPAVRRVIGTFDQPANTEIAVLDDADIRLFNRKHVVRKVSYRTRSGYVVIRQPFSGLCLPRVGASSRRFPCGSDYIFTLTFRGVALRNAEFHCKPTPFQDSRYTLLRLKYRMPSFIESIFIVLRMRHKATGLE